MGSFLSLILFFVFLIMGIPIVFSIGIASVITIIIADVPLLIVVQRLFSGSDSFILTAVPFFLLAGALMSAGGITKKLIEFANGLVGHIQGGLAFVAIIASMLFGGVSGSATADTAAIGSILIPAMAKEGYDREFSSALIAATGTLGIIIPPSIPMILYGVISGVSIGYLFLGGFIPGLMVGVGMMIPSYIIARKRNYPKKAPITFSRLLKSFYTCLPAIIMPIFIIGGIIGGIVTPTEAGVVAVVYSAFVGFFVYKELKLTHLLKIFRETVIMTASVMIIMSVSTVFSWVIVNDEVPRKFGEIIMNISNNKYVLLLLINLFLLIIGTFIDLGPALIITVPIFLPLIKILEIDLLHFGIIVTINLGIGLFTPPVGTNLYVSCAIGKVNLHEISRAVLPFIVCSVIVLFIVTYLPESVMFIPNLLKNK